MKRKTNKTKSIIGFTMGAIVALGALPFSSMQGIFKANAEATKPTYTETKVDLPNSSFETLVDGNFSIGNWTVDYSSKDEGENEQNSTTMSGALNTTFENYATNYTTQFKNMWLESFSANFATLPHLQAVKAALENELGHPANPMTHDILTDSEDKNKNVLYINAGTTFTNFEENGFTTFQPEDKTNREVYYTYYSSDFLLEAYSYYRVSVWVKTAGGEATIALGGDLKDEYFKNITSTQSGEDNIYVYKRVSATGSTTYFYKDITEAITTGTDYTEGEVTYTYELDGSTDTWVNDTLGETITFEGTGNNKGWTKYEIYISTGYNADNAGRYKADLQLSLGGKDTKSSGIVFFDDAKVEKIQYATYLAAYDRQGGEPNLKIADFRGVGANAFKIVSSFNGIDEFHESGWTIENRDGGKNGTDIKIENEKEITELPATFGDDTNSILTVDNYGSKSVTLVSKKTDIEPFTYYKVSIWSRSNYDYSNAKDHEFTVYLNATLNSKTTTTKELKVKPYDSNYGSSKDLPLNNYWTETTLFIEACPIYTTEAWLTISIPKETSFMFDHYTIEKVSSTQYKDTDKTKLSLTTSLPTETIGNGHFNIVQTKENDLNPLYNASDWTESITVLTDVYKYYNNATDKSHTSIINEETYTTGTESDKNYIIYEGKTFYELDDTVDTFVYTPYRYHHSSYDDHDEQMSDVEVVDLPAKIEGATYTHNGIEYSQDPTNNNRYIYVDPVNGYKSILEFIDHDTIEATEKIVIARDVTFSFNEKKDCFESELYKAFELNEKSLEYSRFFHGIVNGYNYNSTILSTNGASYVNPDNVYENYLAINSVKNGLTDKAYIENMQVKYTSPAFTITASTCKLISIYAYIDEAFSGDLVVNLLNSSDKVIASQTITKQALVDEANNWQTISFYVNNGIFANELKLQIVYGSHEASTTGTALFKTATIKSSTTTKFSKLTTDKTLSERESEMISLVNLGNENFVSLGEDLGNGHYDPKSIEASKESTGSLTILDTSTDKDALADYIYENATTPYVLLIKNGAGQSTTAIPNETLSLGATKFYKFEVIAKTKGLAEGTSATLSFTNIEQVLNIKSEDFQTYTMYIATGDKTLSTNYRIELLNASGEVVIDSVALTSIDESTFKTETEALDKENEFTAYSDNRAAKEEAEKEEDITPEDKTLEILFAALSSLLLVAAIVFAIVFTRVKVLRKHGKLPKLRNRVQSGEDDTHGFV